MVDVDDGYLGLQSVDGDGDRFRNVSGVGDGVGHANPQECCYSISLGSSGVVMADAGATRYLEGDADKPFYFAKIIIFPLPPIFNGRRAVAADNLSARSRCHFGVLDYSWSFFVL